MSSQSSALTRQGLLFVLVTSVSVLIAVILIALMVWQRRQDRKRGTNWH